MAVRNLQELGPSLQRIAKRLMANQDLVKLLYYTDKDPYSHPALTAEEVRKEVYEKYLKIVPRVGPKETSHAIIALSVVSGTRNEENSSFRNIIICIETFTPMTQWIIKDENLRPFAIMGAIQDSLCDKDIGGIGLIKGGDFELNFLTDEMSGYKQYFEIINYE